MAIYTVHMPPNEDAEKARFVREGVNIFALVISFLWLLWHRLWIAMLAYVAFILAVGLASRPFGAIAAGFLFLLPGIYLLVEGNELLRKRLARSGWRLAGVVQADSLADAELRFFGSEMSTDATSGNGEKASAEAIAPLSPKPVAPATGIGIFPE